MLKFVLAGVTGIALAGNVYFAGSSGNSVGDADCCAVAPSETVAAFPANLVDMKNTRCIVMNADEIGTSKNWVEYKGKLYHICCPDCKEAFNKDPEKYVKALEAKPADFGLKQ